MTESMCVYFIYNRLHFTANHTILFLLYHKSCEILNVKSTKQQPSCLKIAETIAVLIVFNGVICEVSAYTVTVTVSVALHESGTSKVFLRSTTIYH
jgi:hypothetical protein